MKTQNSKIKTAASARTVIALAGLLALLAALPAAAQFTNRLERPDQGFHFFQFNLAGGYDSREPDDFGLADRGSRTQLTFEWLGKDRERLQRGYTRFLSRDQWNVKVGLELDPAERAGEDPALNLRLYDAWLKIATRWDRTSLWLGHRSIPYGFNPRLDPEFSPMPSQAPLDLGFGRDLGVFFRTPVSPGLDLDLSLTAGGFLAQPLLVASDEDGSLDVDGRIDYRGSWLATARLCRPRFRAHEYGLFAVAGKTHRTSGPLTDVSRLGAEWVIKHREDWKMVHQVSAGENGGDGRGSRFVGNLLNSFEVFLTPRWRFGVTHAYRYEDFAERFGPREERGTVFTTISYAWTRDTRLRLNPFAEYHDATGQRDSGVILQLCSGCGWRK